MIQFIIGITLIALLIQYPSIILLSGVILLCMYIYQKRPDLLERIGFSIPPEQKDEEAEPNLSPGNDGFETTEEKSARYQAEREQQMHPNFKENPEWQKKSAEVNEVRKRNRIEAELEEKEELLQAAITAAKEDRWNEVNRIERDLADLQAKSN